MEAHGIVGKESAMRGKKPNKQTNKVFENLIIGEKRTCGFLGYGNFL